MRIFLWATLLLSFTAHGDYSPLFQYRTDRNLMTNIQRLGVLDNGFEVYAWEWNETAQNLDGRYGVSAAENAYVAIGFVAQNIQNVYPSVVVKGEDGYLRIDERELAVKDQFIRWKLTATSQSVDGRCARVLETRFILCF